MWNRSSTYQRLYSYFQRKISLERKSRIKSEKLPPRRSTLWKISLRYEFIQIMWFFWRNYRGWKNCIFSWKSIYGRIFLTEFGGTFLAGFLRGLFFLGQGKITLREKRRRNSVIENSSKFRRNTSPQESWKNYVKRRQSQTYT